jgi:hypothetical protein
MPLRLQFARVLIVVSFVWPFINVAHFYPDSTIEINFFLIFLAIGLAPEAMLNDKWSLLLLIPAVGVAALGSSVEAGLRIIVGVIPLLFLLGLYRSFAIRGRELIPRSVAYRALQAFVGFSAVQYIDQNFISIIPGWLTDALTVLLPRYTSTPYDEFGIRGVQGWASEPSGAAMTCFAFAAVAVLQQPEGRWRVLTLFAAMALFNKSIYAIALLAVLGLALLFEMKNKIATLSALVPLVAGVAYFIFHSGRVLELRNNVLIYGLSEASNKEFFRLGQIVYPLAAFPGIYKPVELFGLKMEPLGLLPLLVGYGSLIGCLIYYRVVIARFLSCRPKSLTLALASAAVFSFVISPDFVPIAVAFAYTVRARTESRIEAASWTRWLRRLLTLLLESAAYRRRGKAVVQN